MDRVNRRSRKADFEAFLDRVVDDAENNRFPIPWRNRDCERFNQFPQSLNAAHAAKDVDRLREEIRTMHRILCSL